MKIQTATEKDIEDLAKLDMLMAEDERRIHPEINLESKNINHYFSDIKEDFKNKNKIYLISKENSEPIGFIFGYIKKFSNKLVTKDNIYGYITKVFVKKEFRGKGYSKVLVKSLLDYFKSKNVTLVLSTGISSKNKESMKLWESLDFELYDLSYSKKIKGNER